MTLRDGAEVEMPFNPVTSGVMTEFVRATRRDLAELSTAGAGPSR
jgi:hypothetical protein